MPADSTLNVRLANVDDGGLPVNLDDLTPFCRSLMRCLQRSEHIVTSERSASIRYQIIDMGVGSAKLTLCPVPPKAEVDRTAKVLKIFCVTVAALQAGTNLDPRIRHDDIEVFRELARPLARGMQVEIGDCVLTTQYLANIDKLLNNVIQSEGIVTGKIERVNVHEKNEFALYPPVGKGSVSCTFQSGMWEQVHNGLKENVTVYGTMTFEPDSPYPRCMAAKRIVVHPPDNELPTLHEVRALGSWGTEDKTAVDFVRSIRDEQEQYTTV